MRSRNDTRIEGAELGITELYAHYQNWCVQNQMAPFAGTAFNQMAKDEIEITLGLRYRHDLKSEDGTAVRGWKNLTLVKAEAAQVEIWSERSG